MDLDYGTEERERISILQEIIIFSLMYKYTQFSGEYKGWKVSVNIDPPKDIEKNAKNK